MEYCKMKRMVSAAVAIMAAFFCLTACVGGEKVPFETVNHYFFRNNAERPADAKINTANDFLTHFGMGPVMGEDGRPTFVDFKEKFVIAVVPPRTDTDTELIPVSLVRKGDTLTFTYQEKTGAKVPYVMQPLLLVAVDRQYEAPNVVVKKK